MNGFTLRNTNGNWNKPVVVPDNIDTYYRRLVDKRLFDMAYVLMVEEEDAYVLIKNMWKYDDSDMKICRNFNGDKFTVEDIEFLIVGERDYLNLDDLRDVPKHLVIRLVKEDKKNMQ